jgi:hypothetical protein
MIIIDLNPRDKKLSPTISSRNTPYGNIQIERNNIKIMNPLRRAIRQTKHSFSN